MFLCKGKTFRKVPKPKGPMELSSTSVHRPAPKKKKQKTAINALNHDILCMIFAFLDISQLIRCSAVCKLWNTVIDKLKLLQIQYHKQQGGPLALAESSSSSSRPINILLEQLAFEQHRFSLHKGPVNIFQWKGHSAGVSQCRMKRRLILTGVGDKVMRLWSVDSYSCLDEYALPDRAPLIDFDFDEGKASQSLLTYMNEEIGVDQGYTVQFGFGIFTETDLKFEFYSSWMSSFAQLKAFPPENNLDKLGQWLAEICSYVVGLVGTRICIWTRTGARNVFSSRDGMFTKGLCMCYVDPEAVVGCEDGKVRVFDMYSRKCSQIIKMHHGPVTCLSFSQDQVLVSGSSCGSISVSDLASDQQVSMLKSTGSAGIKTLCWNPRSHIMFAGLTDGHASCWDLRTSRRLWEKRVSPNALYSMNHLKNDTSTLVVGGLDGVLRVLDQDTGEVLSMCVMDEPSNTPNHSNVKKQVIERKKVRRLAEDERIDALPLFSRPPITCLAVGRQKVVTAHSERHIRVWRFSNN